jgi:hypothetical protein
MEQDKQLKEILLNSAEKPSADFTDAVMLRVRAASEAALYYQPLVSPQLKRLFVYIFGALIAAIAGLCLLIALTNLTFVAWVQSIPIPGYDYRTILMFILSFWFVFAINSIIERKLFAGKGSHLDPGC